MTINFCVNFTEGFDACDGLTGDINTNDLNEESKIKFGARQLFRNFCDALIGDCKLSSEVELTLIASSCSDSDFDSAVSGIFSSLAALLSHSA